MDKWVLAFRDKQSTQTLSLHSLCFTLVSNFRSTEIRKQPIKHHLTGKIPQTEKYCSNVEVNTHQIHRSKTESKQEASVPILLIKTDSNKVSNQIEDKEKTSDPLVVIKIDSKQSIRLKQNLHISSESQNRDRRSAYIK